MPSHPIINIDLAQLEALMRMKPTLADTAAFFKCSERTIERYIRDNFDLTFVEFRHQNMVHTRLALIREALKQAQNGNTALLIFCLKNVCGWTDKLEVNNDALQSFTLKYGIVKKERNEVIEVEARQIERDEKESAVAGYVDGEEKKTA